MLGDDERNCVRTCNPKQKQLTVDRLRKSSKRIYRTTLPEPALRLIHVNRLQYNAVNSNSLRTFKTNSSVSLTNFTLNRAYLKMKMLIKFENIAMSSFFYRT